MSTTTPAAAKISTSHIVQTWWPLAASWLIMTVELPMLAAVVARKNFPEIQLAAWGVVFPLALILASPVTMLLAASTTLSKDWAAYRTLRCYMFVLAFTLTGVHALLAFTPLFDLLVGQVIGVPAVVVEPARLGFRIMLPWSFALAYRRFHYGVLIRFGKTRAVTMGSVTRLAVDFVALTLFYFFLDLPGIAVAAATITAGVSGEALYAKLRVAPILAGDMRTATTTDAPLTLSSFTNFYLPLVMTSLMQILVQPLGIAALSRMPDPLNSLAVWPVVYGLLIVFMSSGIAYTEVVVILLEEPHAAVGLQRFAVKLALVLTGALFLLNATPLAAIWFGQVLALPPELISVAQLGLWIGLLVPGLTVFESWFSGVLLFNRRTRGITEAVFLGLLTMTATLLAGIALGALAGIAVAAASLATGSLARVLWLWWRTRRPRRQLLMPIPPVAA